MPSTYSPNLRLELIGTGDQAGVWSSTTNINLGTLIEGAISSCATVSILATPQALTAYDGAEDQSRNAVIELTTSTSADFTVCIPPAEKLYVFYNNTSYVATIGNATAKNGTTLTGGTTVAIPAGKTMSVWSDGTNVAQQNNHLISPTLASPAMSGTPTAPTATNTTDNTQVATTAFVHNLMELLHPVGSIYMNATDNTNPGTLFGFGTWVAFGAGRVPVGYDASNTLFDAAEETGGSYDAITVDHTHTATSTFSGSALAGHTHSATDAGHYHNIGFDDYIGTAFGNEYIGGSWKLAGFGNASSSAYGAKTNTVSASISVSTVSAGTPSGTVSTTVANAGSSGTNANIQPYITVYMWKRTA